jgi:plastocyanin
VHLFYLWQTTSVYYNVSYTNLFPQNSSVIGQVMYVPSNETINSSQPYTVYIMDEEPSCEQKLACIDETSAAILIENRTRTYTFSNQSLLDFPLAKVSHDDDNLTTVVNEIATGQPYTVESITENTILVFSNMSENASILPREPWVGILKLGTPSEVGGSYAKFLRIIAQQIRCRIHKYGQGIILSDFNNDTYFMTHSVHEWGWFRKSFKDRHWVPLFSVNNSIGQFLWDNHQTATVSGFIDQEYRQQTTQNPGVISHNVVAYRNTTNSPNNAIAVLSNRMDGWWAETPGDSGVGGAILLGIAKYFHDNNITPKYNLTFLFTTGEEYGMRGAQHFVDSHPKNHYNFLHFIGFDQLGFNYTESQKNLTLGINVLNADTQKIIDQIENITSYTVRSGGYNFETTHVKESGAEDYVWKNICNTIAFAKDTEGIWDGYHRSGMNYAMGDSLSNIDRRDVNATFELAWNITKYFTVNPNCWFNNTPTYHLWDSNHDTINDSVNVSFSVKTKLPHDRIWVKATLVSKKYPRVYRFTNHTNYIITPAGIQDTLTVTLPREAPQDQYYLKVYLYNSTGEIDRKCHPLAEFDYLLGSKYANEVYEQGPFWMHPANHPPLTPEKPSGDDEVMVGIPHFYTTSTTDPEGDPIWYRWKYETSLGELLTCWRGPYNSGEEDSKLLSWISPGIYNVSVRAKYRWNPNVMSNWSLALPVTVSPWFGDPVEWNNDLLDDLSHTVLAVGQQTSSNGFAQGVHLKSTTRESLNWTWEYGDGNVSYGETASHSYSQIGNYTVILRIRNSQGYYYNCSKNVTVLLLNAGFTTGGDIQGGKTALFNDASAGVYQMENWTWDFGDGTISYQRNTSHVYTTDGVYNVTLTVRDIENNTHSVLRQVIVETVPPQFIHIGAEPKVIGSGST